MQLSDSPTLVPLPFADSGSKNVIPEAASPTPGLASLTTGFPPVTMTPLAAGGIPPAGQDMNGILNLITQSTRWAQGGGPYAYNSAFATDSNVNGYPQGAVISRADYTGQWISTADNNTVNPDTVGTNWVPGYNYGTTSVTGLTNANVTLTPAQAAKSRITLAGTLTGNVQIIFPVWTKDWSIVNNTTGAFTVTCKTSAGTGIAIPQDASPTKITGDGTNITQLPENVATATASQHAVQLGQIGTQATALGFFKSVKRQVIASSSTYTPSTNMVYCDVELIGGGGGGGGSQGGASAGAAGGGGGAGGYVKKLFTAATIGASVSVTIGAAGSSSGAAGVGGGNGGASTFLTLSAGGGMGGAGSLSTSNVSSNAAGGVGGTALGGDINVQGQPGLSGVVYGANGGLGGSGGTGIYGAGGQQAFPSGAGGNAGNGKGSGGSGASSLTTNFASGVGTAGLCIVTEYCSS